MTLSNKNILIGVGGGIAAFKAVELVREMTRRGAEVRVAMTNAAQRFVGATTFTGLTGQAAITDLWDSRYPGEVHVALAEWAHVMVIAPATHNLLARMTAGLADDAVLATATCASCPIVVAPAMHTRMWHSKANQRNVSQLRHDGVFFVGPVSGPLASGQSGMGRMAEACDIADGVAAMCFGPRDLEGKTVLVSAGPTQEDLDPIRFISNRSSGRMGFAIAEAARDRGAHVIIVCGPTSIAPPVGTEVTSVRSALDMQKAIASHADSVDAIVMTAAVADYRPKEVATQKMKKQGLDTIVELVRNPDILAELGAQRSGKRPVLVGFAMETQDIADYARRKLVEKRVDLVVGNHAATGFGGDENEAIFVSASGDQQLPRMTKRALGDRIWDHVLSLL